MVLTSMHTPQTQRAPVGTFVKAAIILGSVVMTHKRTSSPQNRMLMVMKYCGTENEQYKIYIKKKFSLFSVRRCNHCVSERKTIYRGLLTCRTALGLLLAASKYEQVEYL